MTDDAILDAVEHAIGLTVVKLGDLNRWALTDDGFAMLDLMHATIVDLGSALTTLADARADVEAKIKRLLDTVIEPS